MIDGKVAILVDDPDEGLIVLLVNLCSPEMTELIYELSASELNYKVINNLYMHVGNTSKKAAKKKTSKTKAKKKGPARGV